MEPTAEQLIRDYLNRLSVAARSRLRSDDRRAFLARTREFIESRPGADSPEDAGRVLQALASLGDPETAAERERDRLAAERSKRASARSGLWRPQPRDDTPDPGAGPDPDAAARRDGDASRRNPRVAVDVSHLTGRELTGDIEKKIKVNRPIASRWRPGAPVKQRPVRPGRIPRPRSGGSPAGGAGAGSRPAGAPSGPAPSGPASAGAPRNGAGAPRNGAAAPRNGAGAPASSGAVPPAPAPRDATSPGPDAGPEPVPPGQGRPPWTAPAAAPTAAAPADGAGGSGPGRPPGMRWRPQRGGLAGVTRGAADGAAGFWRRNRLEASSVALLTLGALIYPYPIWVAGFALWLLGVALAVPSKVWSLWDKWTGLLGAVVVAIAGTSTALALGGTRRSMSAYFHEALADARYMIPLGALLGAGYLAWRLRRGRRGPRVPPWNRPHRI